MRKITLSLAGLVMCLGVTCVTAQTGSSSLQLNPEMLTQGTVTLPNGKTISYRAFENIYYVKNVADSTYQSLNIYIPETIFQNKNKAPVFLKTNVGGYMAAKASAPSPTDATGRALLEGYVVVIPGSRGSNSQITSPQGSTIYTGRAPNGLLDLKAAIRYIRHNAGQIFADTENIITDGTSAGGAMSSLLGATGNHPAYEPYLDKMGAVKERDDIFAAVCFCPITDLEHADMAYEWLYNQTNSSARGLSAEQIAVSGELASLYPAYLNSLKLKTADGIPLTDANYRDYIKHFLILSAQKARNAGADIPENTGVELNKGFRGSNGEFVMNIDLDTYLTYVVNRQPLKAPPAFDAMNVIADRATAENNLFGDDTGSAVNFTDYSLRKATGNSAATIDPALKDRVYLMNPMNFIADPDSKKAPHWYIRHGAADRDTGFQVPINLYTKLINHGYDADFALAWNRGHMGDYNLDELFDWLNKIVK